MPFHRVFTPSHLGAALVVLATLFTSCKTSVVAEGSEASASPCTRFTVDNWKKVIGLAGMSPEFGVNSQMWIYMHDGHAYINGSPVFEDAFGRLQMQDSNLSCAMVNCVDDPVLCNSWLVSAPTVMHISYEFHAPLLAPKAEWRRISLAASNSTVAHIETFYKDRRWRDNEVWDGFLHPYTGALGKHGGGHAWGVFKFWFDKIPQWFIGVAATVIVKRFLSKLNASDESMITAANRIVPRENLR